MRFDESLFSPLTSIFKECRYPYRPAISQTSCRRLPAFQFHCRLTSIDDNTSRLHAYNCNTRRTLTWNITHLYCVILVWSYTCQESIVFLLDTQCIQQTGYGWVGWKMSIGSISKDQRSIWWLIIPYLVNISLNLYVNNVIWL